MTMERITSLCAPPVVGRYYRVPTVFYPWLDLLARPWPVFLPKHDDAEHLNFPWPHYHVDPRFLGAREWGSAVNYSRQWDQDGSDSVGFQTCQQNPLSRRVHGHDGQVPHPPVVWRALRCARSDIPYQFRAQIDQRLTPHFAGRQCKRARSGWVCPHRAFPLGSLTPVDGVITCPLHGLRIDDATGVVLGAAAVDAA